MLVGKAIKFNPSESIINGSIAKKIPMGALTEFQRKINGFEYSEYNNGPKFRNGDTVVAKITPCLENGKTAFVDILDDNEIAFGSSEFIVLRKTEYTDSEFIYYFARSPLFRERAINCMEGTSGRKRVNENTLKNLEFVFPDLPTQKSIAKVLSDLDTKIELNNRINRELEAMAKTLYDYWFVQFDFPVRTLSGVEGYKSSGGKIRYNAELKREIPEGWEVKNIFKCCNVQYGFPFSTDYFNTKGKGVPVIRIRDILENSISNYSFEQNIDAKYLIIKGDILVGMDGNFHINYWAKDGCYLNQRAVKLSEAILPNIYLKYQIEPFIKLREKSVSRTTVGHLSDKDLKALSIIIPSKAVLSSISSIYNGLLKRMIQTQNENQQLSELRDWLLPMLMNGQVTVKEAEERLSMAAEPSVEYKKG